MQYLCLLLAVALSVGASVFLGWLGAVRAMPFIAPGSRIKDEHDLAAWSLGSFLVTTEIFLGILDGKLNAHILVLAFVVFLLSFVGCNKLDLLRFRERARSIAYGAQSKKDAYIFKSIFLSNVVVSALFPVVMGAILLFGHPLALLHVPLMVMVVISIAALFIGFLLVLPVSIAPVFLGRIASQTVEDSPMSFMDNDGILYVVRNIGTQSYWHAVHKGERTKTILRLLMKRYWMAFDKMVTDIQA